MAVPAAVVWARIADAGSIANWFPGFSKSYMVGDTWERRVVALSGIETSEDIVNVDGPTRRLQYRIRPNFLVKQHLATVDVIATSEDTCVVTYATEMEPRALALAISSGTRDALIELKRQVELEYSGTEPVSPHSLAKSSPYQISPLQNSSEKS